MSKREKSSKNRKSLTTDITNPALLFPNVLPPNVKPIFLSGKTQEILSCVPYVNFTNKLPMCLVKKSLILQDLFNRAAISDFFPFKNTINAYQAEEVLICYDEEFKFGQNFYFATTKESKVLLTTLFAKMMANTKNSAQSVAEPIILKYIPPVPKIWVQLVAENDIHYETITYNRKLIKSIVSKKRRTFGLPVKFRNRVIDKHNHALIAEYHQYDDETEYTWKMELHKSTQAVFKKKAQGSQTKWTYPQNIATQTEEISYQELERKDMLESPKLIEFMINVFPRFDLALQQNVLFDIYYDDWGHLGVESSLFGVKADHHLKEYQSFTDLEYSLEKTVTAIDWHPKIKGVIAIAVSDKLMAYERVDKMAETIHTTSVILVWSFSDPIHPQLILEAPDDIQSFKFNPRNPNIIAGGCINGQLVVWDITKHAERLSVSKQCVKAKNKIQLVTVEDENVITSNLVRYSAVSHIDFGHKASVTCVQWIPDHMEITKLGIVHESTEGTNNQIVTCANDSVLFWDIRPSKFAVGNASQQNSPYKALDLIWKPFLKVICKKKEGGRYYSPTCFSIQEQQSTLEHEVKQISQERLEALMSTNIFSTSRRMIPKNVLKDVSTSFYVGTEDGELLYIDWTPQKDLETGKLQSSTLNWVHTYHHGAIIEMHRSPFFKSIILIIGGWTFTVWNESIRSGPLMQSKACSHRLKSASWSSSRPSVFYLGRTDGEIEVWDILDKTHEPSMVQSISSACITTISPLIMSPKQHFLAIGDNIGTLHIFEIPWSLRETNANEYNEVSNYFSREEKRILYVENRMKIVEKQKYEIEMEINKKVPTPITVEDESSSKQLNDYAYYLETEKKFLSELEEYEY